MSVCRNGRPGTPRGTPRLGWPLFSVYVRPSGFAILAGNTTAFFMRSGTMDTRYRQFNTKRRIRETHPDDLRHLRALSERIGYGGNPEHKKNPGDFGLTPPASPRQGKSLCDIAQIFTRAEALRLLQEGMRKGLVSDREDHGWPKNVWTVTDRDIPLEAQLENPDTGCYHGYPMPASDPLAAEVLKRWRAQSHV